MSDIASAITTVLRALAHGTNGLGDPGTCPDLPRRVIFDRMPAGECSELLYALRALGIAAADVGRYWVDIKASPAVSETPWGFALIGSDGVSLWATGDQMYEWANRTGARWPCSALACFDAYRADFDSTGLVDQEALGLDFDAWSDSDLSANEFSAWSSDVLRETLSADHPAHFVTVGQFS